MSITPAEWFEERAKNTPMPGTRNMFRMAAEALREKAEREDPKPLTIEELRQMDGEPVYVKDLGWRVIYGTQVFMGNFYIYTSKVTLIEVNEKMEFYRYKPKEV